MKLLIFTILIVAVSAHNYGKSYSSYPYSGINYGGYGSSLYGASYGSDNGYGWGGAGGSYYSGGDGGYSAVYQPKLYQTARYYYIYPYINSAFHKSGAHGHSTSKGPAEMSFTQDFSGISGLSDHIDATPEVHGYDQPRSYFLPQQVSEHTNDAGSSIYNTDDNGGISAEDLSGFQFAQEKDGIGAQDFDQTDVTQSKIDTFSDSEVGNFEKHSSGNSHGSGSIRKSGYQGFSQVNWAVPQVSFVMGGATLQQQGPRPASPLVPKPVSGAVGSHSKNKAHSFSTVSVPSKISPTRDFSKIPGQQQSKRIRPEISTSHIWGIPASPHSTATQIHPGKRNNATSVPPFNDKPAQKPLEIDFEVPKKPSVVRQPSFTTSHDDSSDHESPSHETGDEPIDETRPDIGCEDDCSEDQNYDSDTSVEDNNTDDIPQSGFDLVPEPIFTNDKESKVRYTVNAAGAQDFSGGYRRHRCNADSYKVTRGDDSESKSDLYVEAPTEDDDDQKSAVFPHLSGRVAPSDTYTEENGSNFQESSRGRHSLAVSSSQSHGKKL